jgi:spermidine/putrescine transport system permease protein
MNRKASSRLLGIHTAAVYAFLYAPILILIIFSFNRSKQTAVWEGFTLQWYGELYHDALIRESVGNSLIVGGLATLIATVVGTLTALAMARYRFPGKAVTGGLIYLPIIIPEIVLGAALLTFFGVCHWQLGLDTVVLAHVTFSISYVAIVVRARLAGFDAALEDAAMDLGAGPWGTFWRVKLPLMMPGIIAGALLVFTISIDDYVITSFVAGSSSKTLPMVIYSMLKTGVTPKVNAVSTLLIGVTVVLIAAAQWLLREDGKTNEG